MANLHNKEMSVHAQPDAGFIRASLCLSQNENGRLLQITMRGITIPVGSVATLTGTKPDGNVYSTAGTISGNVISIQEDMQMTAVAGTWDARLNIVNDGNVIGTAKIRMVIVPDTVNGDAVPSDSRLDGIIAECKAYAEAARGAAYGSPLTANTAADMDDVRRVYVYTGSEDGKVAGNWYYWNGTAWDSGGAYNSTAVNTDTTLALPGSPADSATVGEVLHYKNPAIIDGKTITTTGTTADPTSFNTESGWACAVDDCAPGEVYTISGHGGANTRLWCFIDEDNKILAVADIGKTVDDLRLVAPPKAVKIICNFQPSAHTVKLTKIMGAFYTDYELKARHAAADALRTGEETRYVRDHLNALRVNDAAGRVDALIGARWSLNHISTDNGLDKDNGYNCRTDNFIPVADCDGKLYYKMSSPAGLRLFAFFYDSSKAWISHDAGTLHTGSYEGSITLPPGTAYVRFLLSNEDWGMFDKISDATQYFESWFVPEDKMFDAIYGARIEAAVQSFEADAESARLGYIWISDMHLKSSWAGNTEAVKRQLRAVAEIANRTPIDFVCLGGDIVDAETDADDLLENINDWLSPLAACTKPVIYLIGNHDDNSYGEWLGKLPAKNLIVDRGEFHNSICAPTSNAGYFYFDLDRKGVRVVCLDTIDYESRSGKKGSNWWSLSQSQVEWFANVACNTSYDIVILSHMCPDYDYNSWHLGDEGSYHSDLMTMISTYNSRGTVTKYSKTFDFTNATGKIKMMHVGHSHFEFDDALTVGGIPCIFTSCAKQYDQAQQSYETAVSGKTDTYEIPDGTAYSTCHQNTVGYEYKRYTTRTLGTISEALFDLVSVQNTAANLYRIGAGADRTFTLAATNPRAVKPTDKTLSLPDKAADAKATGDKIDELKEDLTTTVNDTHSYYNEIPRTTASGWRLNENDGLCSINNSYKLMKFPVTAGQTIRVVSDDRFQFQNAASVPATGTSNRVGITYGSGTFDVIAPDAATYLIVSTSVSDSEAVVSFGIPATELINETMNSVIYMDSIAFTKTDTISANASYTWGTRIIPEGATVYFKNNSTVSMTLNVQDAEGNEEGLSDHVSANGGVCMFTAPFDIVAIRNYMGNSTAFSVEITYGFYKIPNKLLSTKNLIGMDGSIKYPVYLPAGTILTISVNDTSGLGTNIELRLYDADGKQVEYWTIGSALTSRTITTQHNAYFLGWSRTPEKNMQVEVGDGKTPYVPYTLDITNYSVMRTCLNNDVLPQSFNSTYHKGAQNFATKCEQFSALLLGDSMNDIEAPVDFETFLFFTDPHVLERTGWESKCYEIVAQIQKYYNSTPTSFCLCGGDWLGNQDLPATACYKMGYIDGFMHSMFDNCYMLVGNHDTNYQGKKDSESSTWTTKLSIQSVDNLWYRGGRAYYSFDGNHTRFYCFDTRIEQQALSWEDNYGLEQVTWFATALHSDNSEHIAVAGHILYNSLPTNSEVHPIMQEVLDIAEAYNDRGSITVGSTTYDYTNAMGKVEFCVCGHSHGDYDGTINGIPYFLTINTVPTSTSEASFDLVMVDYDNSKINLVRVGDGEDRTISLA